MINYSELFNCARIEPHTVELSYTNSINPVTIQEVIDFIALATSYCVFNNIFPVDETWKIYIHKIQYEILKRGLEEHLDVNKLEYISLLMGHVYVHRNVSRDVIYVEGSSLLGTDHEGVKEIGKVDEAKISNTVNQYPRKYFAGFTEEEIRDLISTFPDIVIEKYNEALMGSTCQVVDGHILTYPHDLILALICGLENRDLKTYEWD